ncbi:type III-B CRISPR-associated protein Cas10/Cmr2 [Streptomyces sp. NPDC003393]
MQRFISESRTTSDLSAGSAIIERLSVCAARECDSRGARLVFPASLRPSGTGTTGLTETGVQGSDDIPGVSVVPNRIVALAPHGTGPEIAAAARDAVREEWSRLVRAVMSRDVATPGMPNVQWVSVPAVAGGYAEQWAQAQRLLVARKRLRAFEGMKEPERELCSLSTRWPAERHRPPGVPAHEQDRLAAANWTKRCYRRIKDVRSAGSEEPGAVPRGFPSTSAIASAPYRRQVLEVLAAGADRMVANAVSALHEAALVLDPGREQPLPVLAAAAPGTPDARWLAASAGRWVYEDTWQEDVLIHGVPTVAAAEVRKAVARGRRAALQLRDAIREHRVAPPVTHLAVIAQDLDSMGRFLSGEVTGTRRTNTVTESWHRQVSARLSQLAQQTTELLETEHYFAVPVYAGGDDLLAFAPARHALAAARACRDAVPDEELPSASTAVLFFHHRSPLQRAVVEVQRLLEQAKENVTNKNGLAVGYIRRSGVREQSVQKWSRHTDDRGPAEDFAEFLAAPQTTAEGAVHGRRLSLGVVYDCLRDEEELISLPDGLFTAEMRRLVTRHGGTLAQADALVRLSNAETGRQGDPGEFTRRLAEPVKVAAFLRQECGGGGS